MNLGKQFFPNGWGVSVIDDGYGSEDGLFELAVLGPNGRLHYDNPVANGDVRGYLTEEEVLRLIEEVKLFAKEEKP